MRKFWWSRLGFIIANTPLILWMQFFHPSWLIPYLVWMSWATWLSSELPTGGEQNMPKPEVHFDGLSVGRIVHYTVAQDQCRAAIVVRTWEGDKANLAVLLDGGNDRAFARASGVDEALNVLNCVLPVWKTSILHDVEGGPNTFHSPTACPFE